MRKLLMGLVFSFAMGGVAYAGDFVVVASSDPAIARHASYDAGDSIVVAKGATVTLVNGAGVVTRVSGGRTVLAQPAGQNFDKNRFAGLVALLDGPQTRRTFGAMRGGDYADDASCPKSSDLVTIEQISSANDEGCVGAAKVALSAYLDRQAAAQ